MKHTDYHDYIDIEGEEGICTGCGELSISGVCNEKIADFRYGRPATQNHYYIGSICCGESMEYEPEIEEPDTP